ncbi:hypothetical protein BGX33_003787 [Mortierella sp. NVP41]|nr:hypothetical protein BGX33_003787 [Mortierella sp. NVP41]
MPPKFPTKRNAAGASRVRKGAQEQTAQRRRERTEESIEGLEQEGSTSEMRISDGGQDNDKDQERSVERNPRGRKRRRQNPRPEQPPGKGEAIPSDHGGTASNRTVRHYTQHTVQHSLPSVMAQIYALWKDDLDFVAGQETYWGTVAPRRPDRGWEERNQSLPSAEDTQEQEQEGRSSGVNYGTACTPCRSQGLQCSGHKPVCFQCYNSQDRFAATNDKGRGSSSNTSSSNAVPTSCSYPNGGFSGFSLPKSNSRARKPRVYVNLAATMDYPGEKLADWKERRTSSRKGGQWKVGEQGGTQPMVEAEMATATQPKTRARRGPKPKGETSSLTRQQWLVQALFVEDENGEYPKQPAPAKEDRPEGFPKLLPRGRHAKKRPEEPVQEDSAQKEPAQKEPAQKEPAQEESVQPTSTRGRPKKAPTRAKGRPEKEPPKKELSKIVSRAHPVYGPPRTQEAVRTDEEDADEVTGADAEDGIDYGATTPVSVNYKMQIASTLRPWIAQKDEKVIPSACGLPETSFLHSLHYYTSYYYTHASPSPDMFEAMDLTSHIALGMIIQELISDFAFKLGKESQLEDIQVKADKLIAAQHSDMWEKNFLESLDNLDADRPSSSHKQPNSMSDSEGEDSSGRSRSWDELEGLRRIIKTRGFRTAKELVNGTTFDFDKSGHLRFLDDRGQWEDDEYEEDEDEEEDDGEHYLDQQEIYHSPEDYMDEQRTYHTPPMFAFDVDSSPSSSDDSDGDDNNNPGGDVRSTQLKSTALRPILHPTGRAFDNGLDSTDEEDVLERRFRTQPSANLQDSRSSKSRTSDSEDDDVENEREGEEVARKADKVVLSEDRAIHKAITLDVLKEFIGQGLRDSDLEKEEVEDTDHTSDESDIDVMDLDKSDRGESPDQDDDNMDEPLQDGLFAPKSNLSNDHDELEADDMPENDFSPSILTQLSNNRFGSGFTLRQDDDTSSSDEDGGFVSLRGRTFVPSQDVKDGDNEDSSEAESSGSSSDSVEEKKEDGEANDKEVHVEERVEEQKEDEDSEDDADPIEQQEDAPESAPISTAGSDVDMEDAHVELGADAADDSGPEEQSKAWSEAEDDVDFEKAAGSDDEGEGEVSQPVYTTLSATRFGSLFSAGGSYGDDGDEYEIDETGRGGVQSQVVVDDSTTDEESVQQSDSDSDDD